MKKINLLFIMMLLSSALYAQKYTTHSFGYLGGQGNASLGANDSIKINFSGGNVLAPGQFHTLLDEEVQVLVGFPPMVSYFPDVFDEELFISKGYFSDYVQIQWNIISQQHRITRIKVFRKTLGAEGDSLLISTLAPDDFSYRDEFAEKGVLYKYTLFAEGIADDLRVANVNYIEGVGFAFPFGTVAGRITYEGGTAVEGVQVLAETDGNLGGKSIALDGVSSYLSLNHKESDEELELDQGFSLQMWTKYTGSAKGTLFSKGDQYELSYQPGTLSFTVGDATLDMPYDYPVDTFFHVTAVFDVAEGISLFVQENDATANTATTAGPTSLTPDLEEILYGVNKLETNYYQGYIDEIRLWNIPITFDEAHVNFSRYLSGTEEGLSGYWKLNSGIGNGFYDFSRDGFEFNENHGKVVKGEWSQTIPSQVQLAYRGVTDDQGNYVVRGFPYETSGSQYTFTPIFDVHEFEPTQQLRFVGDGASIHNGLDFSDVSSFPVSGTIKYRNSAFPTEGVSILIDGNAAINQDGELIVSDNLGQFTVDVPIGFHSIKLNKNGHVFDEEGRFPPPTAEEEIPLYDYQEPRAGLEFIDNTVVKLVGKVVGGPVEAEKPRGFGLSSNNIGKAQIRITSEKGYDLTVSVPDSTSVYDERDISSETTFKNKFVTVFPDASTGEYVTYLPPEKYVITGVTAGNYVFGDEHHVTLNLEQFFEESESYDELVMALRADGSPLPGFNPIDSAQYDYFNSEIILDTTYVYGGKNFTYQKEKDFILRVKPDIEVVNSDKLELFGESIYKYKDELIEQDIPLIDENNNYTFGHPVFFQQSRYQMFISVFEEYVNADLPAPNNNTRVPVKDGVIEIENGFGVKSDVQTLELSDKGRATYSFGGGSPSFSINGAESFTKPFSLTAITGQGGNIRTVWKDGSPLRGIVFGGRPQGNNFVTTGPNQILTILRDPPGSNSHTYLEQGSSITTTVTWGNEATSETGINASVSLGPDVEISRGVGVEVTTEIDVTADLELGLELTSEYTSSNESQNTITSTKTWSTSDNPTFVNSSGDVFVGHSTNIVYGAATTIQPIPVDATECVPPNSCGTTEHDGFKLGQRKKLRLNPEFGTMFIFTQSHIENVLIPDLANIRNSVLSYSANPESVVATDEVLYLSLVPPSDERFGSANYSIEDWGDEATVNVGDGPSYKILVPDSFDQDLVSDTIAYFNKQVEGWIKTLKDNEQVKVQAQLSENISFDGGTKFSSSEKVESSSSNSFDFNVSINASMAASVGIEVSGVGAEVGISQSLKMGTSQGGGSTVANETTYSYELADEESAGQTADFYSIDVKTPSDGFGPVFVSRAGVTSCPFEGEEKTQYFEPGSHILNFATIQIERPEITIVNPLVANVPSNREAEITLELKNESENHSDVYYFLKVDDQSNPKGAVLSIDGSVLTGDGRSIFIPGGEVVTKILKVAKGTDDENDYEDIGLKLSSGCDSNISDSQSFSVYFQPGCSDIRLVSPVDLWVINTNTVPEKTQNVVFDDYDLQNGQFKYAKFQYKASSSSQWLTNMIFYNPLLVDQAEYDELDEPKTWLDESGKTLYPWDMSDLPDRAYDLQVVSVCEISAAETAETPTETHSGTKDTKRPVAFGAPQPADGVLSANDEIMIQFNETIEEGLLTPFNFSVQGVLNSADIAHSTSVNFDGVDDYVKIDDGLNLDNRSFTIEFWIKREDFSREQIVYSKGYSADDIFEFGFTSENKFFLNVAGKIIASDKSYEDLGWNHFAVVYSRETELVDVYMNDEYALTQIPTLNNNFTGQGSIILGKSQVSNDRHLNGNIHEFRVWTKARQFGDVFAKMNQTLTGSEVGLVGYWPMEEALGNKALDRARFRHATLFADWEVSPKGQSYSFDGVDDYLELNTASTIIVTQEMDYTIEFWFKGVPGQTNAVMFSNGTGDGIASDVNDPINSVSIGFDESGTLFYLNNGVKTEAVGDYLDNDWHHFSFTLLRQSNANLLVDGLQKATLVSSNFGGLSSAKMWLGARGFRASTQTTTQDRFFNGQIDELRVWNLGKKSKQVNLNINSRLTGDELGLIGYYPFEYYQTVTGIKILNSTLEDQWNNPYGPNGGLSAAYGGADFSEDSPNIKDSRPVQKIDFDWAVNDDKVIITPSSNFTPLIEQTILEITMQNVEDLFENRLASPVTWTAFVDRNQLKWDTDQIIAKKEVYEKFTFQIDIMNYGGTESSFSIDNLPAWLSASPSSGVMSPVSGKTIMFTVDEGLNTGNYLEDIFLSSDFGFNEKLTIDLQVNSPEPDWNTNPFDFQFSMSLIAQLEIGDILSTDTNDKVAAFVNDTIRGDAKLIYIEALDLYEVYLDIYSNTESGELIELRVWDSDKGVEYRNALPAITFSSNSVIGTPSNPDKIIAGDTKVQYLNFKSGWNWSSFNVESPTLSNMTDLMSSIDAETGDQIKGMEDVEVYVDGNGWLGTITFNGGISIGSMYQFKLRNPGSIQVIGTQATSTTPVSIKSGWNMLGFIPRFNMNLNEAFAFFNPSSGDIIKSQFAFAVYQEGIGWTGSLKNMEHGKGYLFNSANAGTLTYPEVSSLSNGRVRISDNIIEEMRGFDKYQYPNNMSIIAEISNSDREFTLVAMEDSNIRGVMKPIENNGDKTLYFMTVYGDEISDAIRFKALDVETGESFMLNESISFTQNQLIGSIQNPLELTSDSFGDMVDEITIYPNPFSQDLVIVIPKTSEQLPEIVMTDLAGRELSKLTVIEGANSWNGKLKVMPQALKPGIYLINVELDGELKSYKVIKN